jgi:RsmE family RNA methyltransferase
MNLILLEPADFVDSDRVRISDRRHLHIVQVHRADIGDTLSVGVLGGRIGSGTIVRMGTGELEMSLILDRDPPEPLPVAIILALPRPKVMRRVLLSLTVLGAKRIILINSARVEKSYWQSPFLKNEAVRSQLLKGLELAGDTILPQVQFRHLFRPFVEDELPALCRGTLALVAHPQAAERCPSSIEGPVTLAIGPEGGFVPFEIEALRSSGMDPVSLSARVLNIETAVPAILAKLFL